MSVDSARAVVDVGELAQFKDVHTTVFSKFQQGSVQRNECDRGEGTQKLFVDTSRIPK